MEFEQSKGNESPDPFGLRSAMERKMKARGDDPASCARRDAEEPAEVSEAEIAELLGPHAPDDPEQDG